MRFPEFKNGNSSVCNIDSISKGVTTQTHCRESKELGLTDCNNVVFKDGFLQNRPGFFTDFGNLIYNLTYSKKIDSTTETTGIEIDTDYGKVTMLVEKIDYDNSTYILLTHLMLENGNYYDSIPIYFQRTDRNKFYVPVKVNFFRGKPISGEGIFAFVYLENRHDSSQKSTKIFELNSALSTWNSVSSLYVPTVYINGRGNYYEKAKSTNQAFEGTPKFLESLNLLEHRFHAYYSTDGYSSSFRLPYSSLADDSVVCRLYYTISSYVEWVVPAGQNTASPTLYSVSVKMTVNREKGIVSFSVPAGEYAMPLITERNENNIRITATKTCDYSITDLLAADRFLSHNGKLYLAAKGCVFSAKESNPLYFPRESVVSLAEHNKKINALAPLGNKIIAFCDHEVLSINVTDGKALNTVSLLAENDSVFYAADTLKYTVISDRVGCDDNTDVCSDLKRIFWIGGDKLPYCLLPTGNILCLSSVPPKYWLTDWPGKCFGIISGNDVIFLKANYALVLTGKHLPNSQNDTMELYYWEFPSNLLFQCGYIAGGKPRIAAVNVTSSYLFVSTLGENRDSYLENITAEFDLVHIPINSSFETQCLTLGSENSVKRIDSVSLNLDCENASISLNDGSKKKVPQKSSNQKVKLLGPHNIPYLKLSLEVENPFMLGEIDIKYADLKD